MKERREMKSARKLRHTNYLGEISEERVANLVKGLMNKKVRSPEEKTPEEKTPEEKTPEEGSSEVQKGKVPSSSLLAQSNSSSTEGKESVVN